MRLALLLFLALAACTSAEDPLPPTTASTGGTAGSPDCPSGEFALADGSCIRPGVPPDGCAEGFAHDGDSGCTVVLPEARCEPGTVAYPGETECHPLADCGTGTWGEIPIDGSTVFVDQSYAGNDSDGSVDRPFTTITEAIATAAPDGIVAIASGSYDENLHITTAGLQLWGRCPAMVEISGPDTAIETVSMAADDLVLRRVAVTGGYAGVVVTDAEHAVIENVWVHDTTQIGVLAYDRFGPASLTSTDVLVERATAIGMVGMGVVIDLERVAVRETRPSMDGTHGRGMELERSFYSDSLGSAGLRSSVFERNRSVGVFVASIEAVIEATVVRDTMTREIDGADGIGIVATDMMFSTDIEPARAHVTTSGVVVERNADVGVLVMGSDALIDNTSIRDTSSEADGRYGRGISMQASEWESDPPFVSPCTVQVRTSLVDRNLDGGVVVFLADLTLEQTLIRDTKPRPFDDAYGDGVVVLASYPTARVRLDRSAIIDAARAGLSNFGAEAAVVDSAIRCNPIDFAAEIYFEREALFEDLGNNTCGCETPSSCKVLSSNLAPPEALDN